MDTFLWLQLLTVWDYLYIPRPLTTNRIHGRQVAVSTRSSLRSVQDHRRFWPGYLEAHAEGLELGRSARLRARLTPLGSAGSAVAVELLKRNWRSALDLGLRAPTPWLPVLPLFVARAHRRERARTRALAEHVPYPMMYP